MRVKEMFAGQDGHQARRVLFKVQDETNRTGLARICEGFDVGGGQRVDIRL